MLNRTTNQKTLDCIACDKPTPASCNATRVICPDCFTVRGHSGRFPILKTMDMFDQAAHQPEPMARIPLEAIS